MKLSIGLETRYHGPTNHRGSRVSVRRTDNRPGDKVQFYPWPCELNQGEAHLWAAEQFKGEYHSDKECVSRVCTDRGFIFAYAYAGDK